MPFELEVLAEIVYNSNDIGEVIDNINETTAVLLEQGISFIQ
jgi:hypothetical protein